MWQILFLTSLHCQNLCLSRCIQLGFSVSIPHICHIGILHRHRENCTQNFRFIFSEFFSPPVILAPQLLDHSLLSLSPVMAERSRLQLSFQDLCSTSGISKFYMGEGRNPENSMMGGGKFCKGVGLTWIHFLSFQILPFDFCFGCSLMISYNYYYFSNIL